MKTKLSVRTFMNGHFVPPHPGRRHEPQPKKREQAPRTPNASRWNVARAFREAFGMPPACRRFGFRALKRGRILGSLVLREWAWVTGKVASSDSEFSEL